MHFQNRSIKCKSIYIVNRLSQFTLCKSTDYYCQQRLYTKATVKECKTLMVTTQRSDDYTYQWNIKQGAKIIWAINRDILESSAPKCLTQ